MREYKVTNRTQGRLELRDVRKVLDAGAWTTVAEPLPEAILLLRGGRMVTIEEIEKPAAPPRRPSLSLQSASVETQDPPRTRKPNKE